ncbi:PAS domain S-box protein [Methanoregula sp.]|uniref:PAS domain S-box protein n=1 Tax=Methanoregula sp. TaxID=2052170 RepID=UPI002371B98B|nr:PAS domain S-box protein [Methanoregula sp.]MDD1686120.1 PAS domain S-box protein [Methanoregula sp.]
MALRREITTRITDLLEQNPQGLSITEIVQLGSLNRNTVGRYLDNLLVSGQVEMRHFGMAKIYTMSQRLPVSSVLSISSELVMQLDASLRIVFINQPFLDLLKKGEHEIIGKNIEFSPIPLFFDETFQTLLAWLHEGLTGTESRGELEVPSQTIFFFYRIVPTVFNNGQKGVSVLFDDITNKKHSRARLRESEARLRSIIRVAPIGIGLISNRMILEANDQVCRMTGYEAAELIGYPTRKVFPSDEEHDRVGNLLYGEIARTGSSSLEVRWQKKDGTVIDIHLSATPLDSTDPGAGLTFTALDITERKRAEAALQASEEKFRTLFNIADDMITLHGFGPDGLPGTYLEVNDVACRQLKYTREELLTKSPRDIIAPESSVFMARNTKNLRANGRATFEMVHMTRDGRRIPVEISSHLFNFHGEPMALAVVRDITERKRIDEALRESETRYRSLSEASQDLIYVIDREDRVRYVNHQAAEFLRKSPESVIGQDRSALFPSEISTRQREVLLHIFETGLPVRSESPITAGGEIRWFDHALVPLPDAEGQVTSVLGVSRDITRRVAAEQEQRQNERNNQFIAEHSVDIINRQTPDCVCTYASPSVTRLLGYTEKEVLGRPVLDMVHPDDLPGVIKDIAEIRDSGKDTSRSTFRFRHKDGHYIWFESTTRIVRDENGQVKEFLSVSRDITRRRADTPQPDAEGTGNGKTD